MTTAPQVELSFNPRDLDPAALGLTAGVLGNPREALESALISVRLMMINQMKQELQKAPNADAATVMRIADLAWQLMLPRWRRLSAPLIADAYIRAYRNAGAGDVPISVIYALADQHVDRMGEYYHDSSREALAQGFNTFVNRRVAARAAADRVLDAYGLTRRQMGGYVSSVTLDGKVDSPNRRSLKSRAREYIGTSIRSRTRLFADQELHNVDEQAQQFAWMWLQDKGQLSPAAEKVWITAKDERVCKICGPLHGKRVKINEQFETSQGKIWTPGTHPNCRCHVRLIANKFSLLQKDLYGAELAEFNEEHPRGAGGRFSVKARTKVKERDEDLRGFQAFLDQAAHAQTAVVPEEKVDLTSISTERTDLSGGGLVRLSAGKVNLAGKVDLTPQKVDLSGKVDLTEKTDLRQDRVGYSMPLAEKVTLTAATERVFVDQMKQDKYKMEAERKQGRTLYRPTIKLPKPVYAIYDGTDLDQNGRLELTHHTEFRADENSAAFRAVEDFEQKVVDAVEDVLYNDEGVITKVMLNGEKLTAEIPSDDIHDIVTYVAYQGRGSDPDWAGDGTITVEWRDGLGKMQYAEKLKYSEIAEYWGLEPEQFEVVVLKLTEGHDSSLGSTVNETYEGVNHHETWTTSGLYVRGDEGTNQIGHSVRIRVIEVLPDVETEVFGDHTE